MTLARATEIAERIKSELAPFCDRIEIAGSIRRRKPDVGDIEIVAIPRRVFRDSFDSKSVAHPDFVRVANSWPANKGNPNGKYTQRRLPDGINLDLFMAWPENWGLILAIRTGSAEYSHRVLANGWCRAGYHSIDGMLCTRFHKIPVREERDLFALIGLPWADPWERNL